MKFEAIYAGYYAKLFRLTMGYTNDEAAAKDLVQEIFLIVWQELPKFRGESGIGTWIYRIASNRCLLQLKKDRRLPKSTLPAELPENLPEDLPALSAAERGEQVALLYRYISELPETDRIVISLELEDILQAEIARITGLSESNVRVKIHRIKNKLTEKFRQRA